MLVVVEVTVLLLEWEIRCSVDCSWPSASHHVCDIQQTTQHNKSNKLGLFDNFGNYWVIDRNLFVVRFRPTSVEVCSSPIFLGSGQQLVGAVGLGRK